MYHALNLSADFYFCKQKEYMVKIKNNNNIT